ncbi:hypothetical protein GCM10010116_35080 [Microbispora rosea subsp. aerata]|nr:hypothetical protein GCM10010116_35080 [Microbispora rosea subsp. aerata]GIH56522.1 hypothetical protein Mro02_34360 [Microbispora rosea subsp. aerata]GLJ81949.1 hypothetical protein GCM10017588_06740 [Microbispora rosea subsp. aerata]
MVRLGRALAGAERRVRGAETGDDHADEDRGGRDGDQYGGPPVAGIEAAGGPDGRTGQHDAEQQQHHDRAHVDQHLHPGDELGGQHQVAARERAEADDQPQRRVDELPGRDDQQAEPTATTPSSRKTISGPEGGNDPGAREVIAPPLARPSSPATCPTTVRSSWAASPAAGWSGCHA